MTEARAGPGVEGGGCLSDPLILAVRKESLLQLPTFPQHVHQQPRQSGEDTPIFKAGDSPMGAADANVGSGFRCFARSLSLFVKENHFWTSLPWVLSLSSEELIPERLSKFSSQPSPPTRSLCLRSCPPIGPTRHLCVRGVLIGGCTFRG